MDEKKKDKQALVDVVDQKDVDWTWKLMNTREEHSQQIAGQKSWV